MRSYVLALAMAALFASGPALSQTVEIGPGGVRVHHGWNRGWDHDGGRWGRGGWDRDRGDRGRGGWDRGGPDRGGWDR